MSCVEVHQFKTGWGDATDESLGYAACRPAPRCLECSGCQPRSEVALPKPQLPHVLDCSRGPPAHICTAHRQPSTVYGEIVPMHTRYGFLTTPCGGTLDRVWFKDQIVRICTSQCESRSDKCKRSQHGVRCDTTKRKRNLGALGHVVRRLCCPPGGTQLPPADRTRSRSDAVLSSRCRIFQRHRHSTILGPFHQVRHVSLSRLKSSW